jgi:hypothetical protein
MEPHAAAAAAGAGGDGEGGRGGADPDTGLEGSSTTPFPLYLPFAVPISYSA